MHDDITPQVAYHLLSESKGYCYLDVRTVEEFQAGHPVGAVNVPVVEPDPATGGMVPNPDFLRVVQANVDRSLHVIVGCKSGGRSAMAAEMLSEAGYQNVSNMVGGFHGAHGPSDRVAQAGWAALSLPVATMPADGASYADLRAHAKITLHHGDGGKEEDV